ncbi:MAG TPA: tetratricopeptide repeat protein, partial [Herpetosiphonaceae bacterium]|nr:tetratricopeptide repeat protein [Herpetosiphonaceae bacterium]
THWAAVQLGHLYFNSGDLRRAEVAYRQVLEIQPDYVYALAGIARVQAARGEVQAAIDAYRTIAERLPLPEFVIALGELYEVAEQQDEAKRQYDLVHVLQQLNAEAGVDVDLELALFDVDHGAAPAEALARARAAYAQRPTVYAADVLAWALYHTEQYAEARRYSEEALRLGTRDAAFHYHAGMIAHALEDRDGARRHLKEALAINPAFSLRHAPQARALLAQLEQ